MTLDRIMRVRLPSYPFVKVKGATSVSAAKPVTKVAGSRRPRRVVPSLRSSVHTREIWKPLWCALISCGLGTRAGSWVFRKWLTAAIARNGWLATALTLKEVCGELRSSALEQRRAHCPGIPKRLSRWLDHRLSVKGKLAFSRLARALPSAPTSVQRKAVTQHLTTLHSRHVTPPGLLEDIKSHVHTLLCGAFREGTSLSVPSSSAATVEAGRAVGGYNSVVQGLVKKAEITSFSEILAGLRNLGRPVPAPEVSRLADCLERRLARKRARVHLPPAVKDAEISSAYATGRLIRESVGKRVVHEASVIAELGLKARIITKPPASLFAKGDLVRQILWPAILAKVPQILPYAPHTEEAILARLYRAAHPDKVWLSADLTCATDGFGHDAILAVIEGLRRAGMPLLFTQELQESLGVGREPHYVRYHLSQMSHEGREYCRKHFGVVKGTVDVPKSRGSLMGTPCSFSILSLLNHWMSERLGPSRIICGDDLAGLTHPSNVSSYAQRAAAVGSKLHEKKSFRSHIGFVFCEAYALTGREGKPMVSFRPPSLKEFVRNGNGVMCQHSVDPSSFNRLARCARTLYKRQRKVAARRQRPAELPAALGGLGHPCKGRLRVPVWCRKALWELYLCENAAHNGAHDPTKFIRTLQVPAIPVQRGAWRKARDDVDRWIGLHRVNDDYDDVPGFVTNQEVSAYLSTCTNTSFLAVGGRFKKVRPQEIKVRNARWPKPVDGCRQGVLSTHTRIVQVLEWDRRARCELVQPFRAPFSEHIRGRISSYRGGDVPGDVEP
uniref:RNA-dependent RNA polymerase n=1 Tax=Exserohilum turcicum narnavirus 5 TaxID=3229037 RepID=A0AAU7YDX3_9VIRU